MNTYERNANRLTIFLYAVLLLVSAAGAIWLPDSVAIHYNLSGKPDRWGNPATLLVLPLIVFFLLAVIWATDKAHPDFLNFPGPRTPDNISRQISNIHRMSATLRPALTLFFLIIQGQSIWAKFYNQDRLIGWSIPTMLLLLFSLIGFFMWRAYKLVPRP